MRTLMHYRCGMSMFFHKINKFAKRNEKIGKLYNYVFDDLAFCIKFGSAGRIY